MDKPDVDFIEGLSPAVSIDQKSTSKNPRSTVGTITEVYDYLRLLYARAGRPHCPECGAPIERQTPQQIVDRILQLEEGTRFQVLAPVIRGRKGEYVELFRSLQSQGFSRARVNGETIQLADMIDGPPKLDKQKKHTIEVVVDRLAAKPSSKRRLTDSIETALNLASGLVLLDLVDLDAKDPHKQMRFSEKMACPNEHDIETDELEPRSFSFNSPFGACPAVPRHRHPDGGRPGAGRLRPRRHPRRGRHRALVGCPRQRLLHPVDGRPRRRARVRPGHPVGGPPGQGPQGHPRGTPDQGARPPRQPLRPRTLLLHELRGRPPLHRAAPPRGRDRHQPGPLRGVHARGAVPGLPGHPAQAGLGRGHAGGEGRGRPQHRRGLRAADQRGGRVPQRARAHRPRTPDRRARAQGDPGAAPVPPRRRPRLPLAGPAVRARSPAARPSASGWPPRSARAWSVSSTCSTSPASGSTSATTSA